MPIPKVYKTEAIVLRRTDLGEADRILTLFTPNLGKFQAVAKGSRRPGSKLGGHVELLTYSAMMLARGQNLDIVTQCQAIESFLPLRDDLELMSRALYLAELVDRFSAEHEENYPIFRLLLNCLGWLCEARDPDLTLRYFELHLLEHLGYQPQLQECIHCKAELKPEANFFSSSGGGILCPACRDTEPVVHPLSVNALKVLRHLQKSDYVTAARLRMDARLSAEVESLMRGYIHYLLERQIKSVEFMDLVRAKKG